jgi:hypothetical protein
MSAQCRLSTRLSPPIPKPTTIISIAASSGYYAAAGRPFDRGPAERSQSKVGGRVGYADGGRNRAVTGHASSREFLLGGIFVTMGHPIFGTAMSGAARQRRYRARIKGLLPPWTPKPKKRPPEFDPDHPLIAGLVWLDDLPLPRIDKVPPSS